MWRESKKWDYGIPLVSWSLVSWSLVSWGLMTLFYVPLVASQIQNEKVILGVYLDSGMIHGERDNAMAIVTKAATEASAVMEKGSFTVKFLMKMEDALTKELVGLLSITSCLQLQNVSKAIADATKIHMAITSAGCMRVRNSTTITIPLTSNSNDLIQLIADMREKNTLTWRDIIVIHDWTITSANLDKLIKILIRPIDSATQISMMVADISNNDTASERIEGILKQLGPRPGEPKKRQFLVIAAKNSVEMIQKAANKWKLMSPKYQWLFVISDTDSLNYDMMTYLKNVKDGDNLAFAFNMSIANPTEDCKNGHECYLDGMVRQFGKGYSDALKKEYQLFSKISSEEWAELKPSARDRAVSVIDSIKGQQETPVCGTCTQWGVQACEVKSALRFELLDVADWRPAMGLVNLDDLFPHITGRFRKRAIIVASVDYPPWQVFKPNGKYEGLIFQILTELGERLNFTYVVRTPPDNAWGNKDAKGTWNGMIRMVMDHEVLLGAAAFTVSTERMTAVNFTNTLDRQPYTFLIERPKELTRALIFIQPFTYDVWLYIGISVLVMGPISYFLQRMTPFYDYYGLKKTQGFFRFEECAWYMYSSMIQQGGNILPVADSGRIAIVFWLIYILLIVTLYSGNLVAFLTFPQMANPVSTLDDLLNPSNSLTWGYIGGTVLDEYFKTAEGKYKEIGLGADVHDRQSDELLNRVRNDDHALIEFKTNLLFVMKKEYLKTGTCDFSLGREDFYFENVALPVAKDFPYLDIFNDEIKLMQMGGLVEKWRQNFWPRPDQCSATAYGEGDVMRTISLSDMQGSFYILFMGGLIAGVLLIFEWIVFKSFSSSSRSPSKTRSIVKQFLA